MVSYTRIEREGREKEAGGTQLAMLIMVFGFASLAST